MLTAADVQAQVAQVSAEAVASLAVVAAALPGRIVADVDGPHDDPGACVLRALRAVKEARAWAARARWAVEG